jgi:hypothetical protein
MARESTMSTEDSGRHTVFVGAHIPLPFYEFLVEEAEMVGVSRSEMLRQMLADRYNHRQGVSREERHDEP